MPAQVSTCIEKADAIGPMTTIGQSSLAERPQMLGAYLRATAAPAITGVPASELPIKLFRSKTCGGHPPTP